MSHCVRIFLHQVQFLLPSRRFPEFTGTDNCAVSFCRSNHNINLSLFAGFGISSPPLSHRANGKGDFFIIVQNIVPAYFFKGQSHIIGKAAFHHGRIGTFHPSGLYRRNIPGHKRIPETEKLIFYQVNRSFAVRFGDGSFPFDNSKSDQIRHILCAKSGFHTYCGCNL